MEWKFRRRVVVSVWSALAMVLCASTADAQWFSGAPRVDSSLTVTSIVGHDVACFDPATSSEDSPILYVKCDYSNWSMYGDKDGSGTASTTTYAIQSCPDRDLTGSAADSGCQDADGSSSLIADEDQAGIATGSRFMRVQASESGASASQGRICVSCSSGSGGGL